MANAFHHEVLHAQQANWVVDLCNYLPPDPVKSAIISPVLRFNLFLRTLRTGPRTIEPGPILFPADQEHIDFDT
jgi:hypothetical protein